MNFSKDIISQIRNHIITYEKANSSEERKKSRQKMQKLGFRMTDFNLRNITTFDFDHLITKGFIKVTQEGFPLEILKIKKEELTLDSSWSANILEAEYSEISRSLINQFEFCGLYCLRLKENSTLPKPFQKILENRDHKIVYLGKAEGQTLMERLGQELYAKGHGTFFRSIGAVLGYLPESGSLYGKSNQNNYKFRKEDEKKIINWIENNLEITVFKIQNFEIEKHLICKLKPLLNDSNNPLALLELRMVKDKCRITARNK